MGACSATQNVKPNSADSAPVTGGPPKAAAAAPAAAATAPPPAKAEEKKAPPAELSAINLINYDATLDTKEFRALHDKYSRPADDASVQRAVDSLSAKTHKVTVVDSKEAALKLLISLIPATGTISMGGSTTLREIGFLDHLKTASLGGVRNIKEEAVKAQAGGDWTAYGKLLNEGLSADVFFSSVGAVSEDGDIVFGDLTGTRVGTNTAGSLVFVVSTSKVVPTYKDAETRLYDYQRPLEGARARIAYSNDGIVGTVANFEALRAANPFGAAGRVHVVLVRGTFGF